MTLQAEPSDRRSCHGCTRLISRRDAAGGTTYLCRGRGGIVLGEDGHWTDESDEPREVESGCHTTSPWNEIPT